MNEQEIFDTVANHLLTQNAKAQDGFHCRYRTKDGLKCAIGCLIKEEDYKPEMEYHLADGPRISELSYLKSVKGSFLRKLQFIHDIWNVADWKIQLERFAKKENLEVRF